MPVIRSAYRLGHAQADGRHYVTFRHVLDTGAVIERECGPVDPKQDFEAIMREKAARIDAAEAEAAGEAALQVEVDAAREKVAAVLVEAEKAGAISKGELELAGYAVAVVEVRRG